MHLVKNWEPAPARSVLAVRDAVEHRKSGSWPFPTSQWGITSVRIQTTEHIHNVISNWKGFSEGNGVLTKLLGGLTRKSRNHHWTIYLNGIVLTLILKTGRCCYYWHGCPLTTNSKLETRIGMPCVSTTTNSNISMALLTSKRNLHVFSEFWKGRKKGMSMAKDFCVLHSIIQQSGMLLNTDDGTAFSFLHLVDFFFNLFFLLKDNCLQNFVVFCQSSTWISHRYTYIPSLLNLSPISLPIPPLQVDIEPLFEFPEPYSKFLLAIYFTYGNISFHVPLSIHLTLSSLLPMSISLCSVSVSP